MQTNVQEGPIQILAGEDLTNKQNYLVKMTHDSGTPEVVLPTHISDLALYLIIDTNYTTGVSNDGENVSVRPLEAGKNVRIKLEGTCSPGDVLVLADVSVTADKGMVRKLPTAAGTYRGIAIAEETGVDGQEVLCRPASIGNITVEA